MPPGESIRRRLIAAALAAAGLGIVLFHDRFGPVKPGPIATAMGPAFLLHGLTGMVLPRATPDFIRPRFGALQGWMEADRWQSWIGGAAFVAGFAIGVVWVVSG